MWFHPTKQVVSQTAEQRTPTSVVVSPHSSDTPSTIGQITPTRKMLFERTPGVMSGRSSLLSGNRGFYGEDQPSIAESRQESEIEDLRQENQRKDDQLRTLHERFQHIQSGLGSIDQERNNLVEKSKRLEKEKLEIQTQLELREREIRALVKRCASQEEKMMNWTCVVWP